MVVDILIPSIYLDQPRRSILKRVDSEEFSDSRKFAARVRLITPRFFLPTTDPPSPKNLETPPGEGYAQA